MVREPIPNQVKRSLLGVTIHTETVHPNDAASNCFKPRIIFVYDSGETAGHDDAVSIARADAA